MFNPLFPCFLVAHFCLSYGLIDQGSDFLIPSHRIPFLFNDKIVRSIDFNDDHSFNE
ncbi:hypothetical protein EH5_03850 [Bacillus subtilis]|nr:hypothetical protein EH5_03850 [Bacillus subtilis]